jgi:hypothetical protein
MIGEHWFWWLMTSAVLVWYSTVAIYVAFKGTLDIRQMLRRLKEGEKKNPLSPKEVASSNGDPQN